MDNNGSSTIFFYGGKTPSGVQVSGFELTNNLLRSGTWGIFGDKAGEGTVAFNLYTPSPLILHNTFAGSSAKLYPVGNDFPTLTQWQGDFANLAPRTISCGPRACRTTQRPTAPVSASTSRS